MTTRLDTIILPDDAPLKDGHLKKLLLFFDSVTVSNPDDYALVHEKEVTEQFGPLSLWWADMNLYPRIEGYKETTADLLGGVVALQNRGLVRTTPKRSPKFVDAGMNYTLWHSAIANQSLVEAAVPERYTRSLPNIKTEGYARGGPLCVSGYTSRYEIKESRIAVELSDVDQQWSLLAHLRIARCLKHLRLAHHFGLVPIAFDTPNQNLLASCNEFGATIATSNPAIERFPEGPLQLDFEILDALDLLNALNSASWKEVLHLRKHTLPGMHKLRAYLERMVRLQGRHQRNHIDGYTKELARLKKEFDNAKDALSEEWIKFGVAMVQKTCVHGVAGLIATALEQSWVSLLQQILISGLNTTAMLSKDIQSLLIATRHVKQQPLYFIERVKALDS